MNVVDRVRNILVTPKTEWPIIDAEPATVKSVFTGYAAIVALLPVVGMLLAALIGGFIGVLGAMIVPMILTYVIGLAVLYGMALIADAMAPGFDGRKDPISALKLVVYAATPQWVAGFFAFIPGLALLLSLVGFGYAAYLLYLGSMATMKVPQAKAVAFTAVVILVWMAISFFVIGAIISAVTLSVLRGLPMPM
jgi:hypothetical protein